MDESLILKCKWEQEYPPSVPLQTKDKISNLCRGNSSERYRSLRKAPWDKFVVTRVLFGYYEIFCQLIFPSMKCQPIWRSKHLANLRKVSRRLYSFLYSFNFLWTWRHIRLPSTSTSDDSTSDRQDCTYYQNVLGYRPLKSFKSPGPDGINPATLLHALTVIVPILEVIFKVFQHCGRMSPSLTLPRLGTKPFTSKVLLVFRPSY